MAVGGVERQQLIVERCNVDPAIPESDAPIDWPAANLEWPKIVGDVPESLACCSVDRDDQHFLVDDRGRDVHHAIYDDRSRLEARSHPSLNERHQVQRLHVVWRDLLEGRIALVVIRAAG